MGRESQVRYAKVQEDDWQKAYKLRTLGPFKHSLKIASLKRGTWTTLPRKKSILDDQIRILYFLYLPSNFRWKKHANVLHSGRSLIWVLCHRHNSLWSRKPLGSRVSPGPTGGYLPQNACGRSLVPEVPNGSSASVQEAHAIPDECCMLSWNNPRKMGQTLTYYDHLWSLISRFVTQTVSKSVREVRIGRFCASRAIGMIIRSMEHVSTSTSITIWQTTPWNSTRSVTVVSHCVVQRGRHDQR